MRTVIGGAALALYLGALVVSVVAGNWQWLLGFCVGSGMMMLLEEATSAGRR